MPLDDFHSQVMLMLYSGTDPEEIARRLGTDGETVRRAIDEAESQIRREVENLRPEDFAPPLDFRALPNPLVTRDGIELRWETVDAGDAVATWTRLRGEFATSGLWPVIVAGTVNVGRDEIARTMDDAVARNARPAAELLARAAATDSAELLRTMWSDSLEITDDEVDDEDDEPDDETYDERRPAGPVDPIPSPLVRDAIGGLVVLLVPVEQPEDVLAVVGWGGWNACPPPEEHLAVLRSWRDRYGAELQALSFDTLELVVARPPSDFAAALPLTREQFGYANDIVWQGVHTSIGELAAALVGNARWYFWWD